MTTRQTMTLMRGLHSGFIHEVQHRASAPLPNWSFNADATTGHALGILMACSGALRTSCSGAG